MGGREDRVVEGDDGRAERGQETGILAQRTGVPREHGRGQVLPRGTVDRQRVRDPVHLDQRKRRPEVVADREFRVTGA